MDKEDFMLGIMTPYQKSMMSQLGPKLICVDGTHGLNAYDFILHTILSVDEYGHGVPLAFLFSNRKDTGTLAVFFQKVHEVCGEIRTNIFMTDDDPAYYNAWRNVMGEAEHQLLCAWHILKNWNEKIRKTIPEGERAMLFGILRGLLMETSEDRFTVLLHSFLQKMGTDSQKQEFLNYFKTYYVNRPHAWAYCYRKKLGINTNMHLEALHKKIKYVYFDGKVVKRIDLAINVLMKITRDIIFERMTKIAKKTDCKKMQHIRRAHTASLDITGDMIVKEGNDHWKVRSQKAGFYDVKRINSVCPESFCPLNCSQCKVCVHMFECDCFDHLLYLNICKHIHAVGTSEEPEDLPVGLTTNREDIVIELSMQIPQCSSSTAVPVQDDVQTLLRKIPRFLIECK
uniref:MULE transposase domain-containing protein n=1 Tax=Cacopsylla melanoneura TaxID=428564 RepID=A0A8D8PZ63_9HEMI